MEKGKALRSGDVENPELWAIEWIGASPCKQTSLASYRSSLSSLVLFVPFFVGNYRNGCSLRQGCFLCHAETRKSPRASNSKFANLGLQQGTEHFLLSGA